MQKRMPASALDIRNTEAHPRFQGRRGAIARTDPPNRGTRIVHTSLRAFSYVVLALMGSGIVYATYIGLTYWTGIGV